ACAINGHVTADPTITLMISRRRIAFPEAQDHVNRTVRLREQSRKFGLTEWGATMFCAAKEPTGRCPLWVIFDQFRPTARCPLFPRKRPKSGHPLMSALCQ